MGLERFCRCSPDSSCPRRANTPNFHFMDEISQGRGRKKPVTWRGGQGRGGHALTNLLSWRCWRRRNAPRVKTKWAPLVWQGYRAHKPGAVQLNREKPSEIKAAGHNKYPAALLRAPRFPTTSVPPGRARLCPGFVFFTSGGRGGRGVNTTNPLGSQFHHVSK